MSNKDITPILHALAEVREEVIRARELHPQPFHSPHEAYGVIQEEFIEFQQQVFHRKEKRCARNISDELTQIAAMAIRAKLDLGYTPQAILARQGTQSVSSL